MGNQFFVKPGELQGVYYVRTGGHDCDGEMGYFQLDIFLNGDTLGHVVFNFDSDAAIYLVSFTGSLTATLVNNVVTIQTAAANADGAGSG